MLTIGPETVTSVSIGPHGDTMAIDVFSEHPVLDGGNVVDVIAQRVDVWPLLTPTQQAKAQQFYDVAAAKATS